MENKKISYCLVAVLIMGLFFSFITHNLVSEFKSMPSPLFGGDLYFQLGCIHHMYESSFLDWFKSANMLGQLPAYLPFYGIIVTLFGKLFGLDPMNAMFSLNLILPVAAVLFTFYFLRSLFSSDKIALLGTLFLVNFISFPILKYTDFTAIILVPLFLYSLWLFYKEQNQRNALLLGLMFAVMGLSHTTSFAYSAVIIVSLFIFLIFEKYLQNKETFKVKEETMKLAPFFAYSFILGFLISQIIWFGPIFIYHGHSELGNSIWTMPDVKDFAIGLEILYSNINSMFLNLSSILRAVISISAILGLYFLIRNPVKDKESTFLLFLFIVSFLLIHSYFITSPLFDFHLVPVYMFEMYLAKISVLVALLFIRDRVLTHKYSTIAFALLIILVFYGWQTSYDKWMTNPYFEGAKYSLSELAGAGAFYVDYSELQNYLLENSDVNDVILSNNELSFAINALSGRKLVVSRRSQNDPFMDFDQRELDAAIIFYGNNLETRLNLLKKYNVKYLYYDAYWFDNLEYIYDEQEQIIGYSDPFMFIASEENENALQQNGIYYFKQYGYIDPAMRDEKIRKYDLLLVSPYNYDLYGYGPWKQDLDPYLIPVWHYEMQGQITAVLYEVDYSLLQD